MALKLRHDEDAEIYLNGHPVAMLTGFSTDYITTLTDGLSKAVVVGDNLPAIHCHNTAGGQFIDTGIDVGTELKKP
jgi:hypothetical protein